MYDLPLPLNIGGSKVTAERVSGPPSKTYPILRDLILDQDHTIEIEIDKEHSRYVGIIHARTAGGKIDQISITHRERSRAVGGLTARGQAWEIGELNRSTQIKFDSIIAFRVLSVKVEKLPGENGEEAPVAA